MGGQGFKITGELLHRSLQGNEHGITKSKIIYTLTDEAPLLATTPPAYHQEVHRTGRHRRGASDISVAARVLASSRNS
jgi:monomeric isocitrate dehydrogenase